MPYKTVQLILTPGKNSSTTSEVFIAQPDTIKEALAGKLFVIVEIESRKTDSLKLINFLIDNLNYNYYQNDKILLREKLATLKVEHIFEATLTKTNKLLDEFIKNENIKIDFPSINIIAGVLHENKIHFAVHGKNKAFLIYKHPDKNSDKEAAYRMADIAKRTKEPAGIRAEQGDQPRKKLFANVVSGEIPEDGHFIFTNEALPEYISNTKLIQIISTLPPLSAIEQIKQILENINSYVSFLCIIVKSAQPAPQGAREIRPQETTKDSIVNLNITEDRTEDLLSPSGIINPRKWLSFGWLSRWRGSSEKDKNLAIKDRIFAKRKTWAFLGKFGVLLKNIGIYIINALFFIVKILSDKQKLKSTIVASSRAIKTWHQNSLLKIKSLGIISKIFLVLAIIFLSLFFINLYFKKSETTRQEQVQEYQNLKSMIEQKQNQTEAKLLYSNEEGAQALFDELQTLLDSYPQETEEQREELSEFQQKFNQQLEKVQKVTRLDAAEIANFTNLISTAASENIVLAGESKKIIVGDSLQNAFYILDTASNISTTLANLSESITSLRYPVLIGNKIYYFNNTSMVELDSEIEERKVINLTVPDPNIVGADTYSERIYLLDNATDQIYRYQKSGGQFSQPVAWIGDKLDLETAVDISIDGHVYVLLNDGNVLKLLRGEKQDFRLEAVDPPLENPSKFFVSPELKFIYILEPSKKRLVLYDKTGQFIMQYLFDNLSNIKDFAIDEQARQIYLLNDNSVWSAQAAHFEE